VFFLRIGERLALSSQENGRAQAVTWFQIEPELRAYDNLPGGNASLAAIRYRRNAAESKPSKQLTLCFTDCGTRYYCAGPVVPATFTESQPIHRKFAGRIVQVVARAGDDYVDFLGELLGTPFIMGPAVVPSGWHQTDQRVGSDCAAFATYGRRRMGEPIFYGGPAGIVRDLRLLARSEFVASANDGVYRDHAGRRCPVGRNELRPGDVIHFGPQVSVFYSDRGVRGFLDAEDLLFQSWRATPHITSLRRSGFFNRPIRVYRWR